MVMKTTKYISIVFSGIIGLMLFSPFAQADLKGFQDFNGKQQVLENYTGKGKWLVVMIWASDCHICNREAYKYVDFNMIHSDKDASVLGISIDGESRIKEAKAFIKRHSIDFPNLIGEPEYVEQVYANLSGQHFAGTPSLIYAPDGELKAAQAGAVPTEMIESFIEKNSLKKASKK
jgi:peroxiredoxin